MRDWLQLPLSPEANHEHPDEEISLWNILLIVFGLKKVEKQSRRQIQQHSHTLSPAQQQQQNNFDEMICNQVDLIDEDEDDEDVRNKIITDYTPLQRTLSCSSIASSIASETSTAASSHADEVIRATTKEIEIPPSSRTVKIYWNHGGQKVQLTGEFDNWTVSVDMIKDNNDRYYANLPLSQSRDIEYKFVVDGQWRFADDLPHRSDWNGNINNVLYREEASHQ